jgi:predicted ester cyclase
LTSEDNKKVVTRFYDALNLGDAKAAAGFWAPDAMNHGKAVEHPAVQKLMEDIVSIHEHIELKEMVGEGDWVACRMIVSGRHKVKPSIPFDSGIYNLTEPAGLPFTAQHIHMFRIVDGKIKEHWANRDDLGAARQLGLDLKPI